MKRSRAAVALGVVLTALLVPAATGAGSDPGDRESVHLRSASVEKRAKLDSQLARLAESAPGARAVRVEAVATSGRRAGLEAAIRAAGGTPTAEYGPLVDARLPVRALERLAANPAARILRTPPRPYPQEVVSEGVASTGAAAWHTGLTTGTGVDVAIVDVGFGGWQARQLAGELPQELETISFCGGGFFDGPDADNHGTAVAEIVHDVAPAAKLTLICIDSPASLGQAKDYVVEHDIPIVNHSVGWLNTSRGDGLGGPGTPEAIAADARAQGVLWVNAAGNYADVHWSGTFSDPVDGDEEIDFHDFAPLDEGNSVELAEGGCVYLKWDDWPASDQDFDLYLFDAADENAEPFVSDGLQNGLQEPIEFVCAEAAGSYWFAISRFDADEAPRMDAIVINGDSLQYNVPESSLIEPAGSPHVLAVGAVCYSTGATRVYSSRGPTIAGRTKPDVAGPDGVSTETYANADGCNNAGFDGTSAATPHIAGAAALIKQANPAFDPAHLQDALELLTGPPDSPAKNNDLGAGLLALGSAPPTPPGMPVNSIPPTITGFFNQGQPLTANDGEWAGGPTVFTYRWQRCNGTGNACSSILSARSKTYVPGPIDVGQVLKVRVTASNSGGSSQLLSAGTPQIGPPLQPPANVIGPSLVGPSQFGQTLTAAQGGWSGSAPLTITIEWLRCDASGGACVAISGATASTYQLGIADIGLTIRVRATATNPAGSQTSDSPPSTPILPPLPALVAPPTIAGSPVEGRALSVSAGNWTFATGFSYQWRRCGGGGTCTDIPGASAATFTPGVSERGLRLQVMVTATNAAGTNSAGSALTSSVATVSVITVPPPRPPGTSNGLRLIVVSFIRSPKTPQAGKRFTLLLRVGTRATSVRGATRRVSCPAKIGRKTLRTASKSVRGGTARCAWAIPKQAAGKRLRSSIVVTEGARSVRKSLSARIRR